MIRTTLNKPKKVPKSVFRLISSSFPRYTGGALQGFTEHEMIVDKQWAKKINYDELEVIREQLRAQQKESTELRHHLEDTNKKIESLKHRVNDLQNVHK